MANPLRWLIGPPLDLTAPVQAAVGPSSPAGAFVPGMSVPTTTSELDALVFGSAVGREMAMTIPAINRARDLICGSIATMPLRSFKVTFDATGVETGETPTPPWSWLMRPDPVHSRAWVLSATADDMLFHGYAVWRIRSRYQTGFPSGFQYLPWLGLYIQVNVETAEVVAVSHEGVNIPLDDLVLFESPLAPVLAYGGRVINTTLKLDSAAERFADVEVPSGHLQQTDGGEPMGADELLPLAQGWTTARLQRATGALNNAVRWVESTYDPQRLQLNDARNHQATECARIMNVPAALIQAPTNQRMTYSNVEMEKQDLFDLGLFPLMTGIEQALSANNVTPRNYIVRADPRAFLRNPWIPSDPTGGQGPGAIPGPPASEGPAADPQPLGGP